jgi:phospholipase A1/A2
MRPSTLAGALSLVPAIALSQSQPQPLTLADCAHITDDGLRLACFDRLAASRQTEGMENRHVAPALPGQGNTAEAKAVQDAAPDLARHWELGPENKRGVFAFRPHQENYLLLANYSFTPNAAPFSPLARLLPPDEDLSHTELKFQLGFKVKLLEDALPAHADIWLGYTQQSNWQAYNRKVSSPFRETNYQPELMAVIPIDIALLGMRARFVNIGLVHQSNGRASTLSRNWNRIYLQTGMEKGNFTLMGRVWQRLHENASDDDNPDILDYMGHGDVSGTYRWQGNEFSVLARYNFHTRHGAAQIGWAFPMSEHLKGYVQAFSGYGASLIDYNYSQRTVGLGVLIDY